MYFVQTDRQSVNGLQSVNNQQSVKPSLYFSLSTRTERDCFEMLRERKTLKLHSVDRRTEVKHMPEKDEITKGILDLLAAIAGDEKKHAIDKREYQ